MGILLDLGAWVVIGNSINTAFARIIPFCGIHTCRLDRMTSSSVGEQIRTRNLKVAFRTSLDRRLQKCLTKSTVPAVTLALRDLNQSEEFLTNFLLMMKP